MKKISGAITAIVTPFTKQRAIDESALKRLVHFQLINGINGIVACGSTGEAATLTMEEYELVVKIIVQEVNGKIPVIAGAGSNDTQKAITFSKIAKRAGADALLHVTPYYNKPTKGGLLAHFMAIAAAVDLPIILYNVPGRTGSNVTADITVAVAKKVPQVVGVKEASGNIMQMMDIVKHASKEFLLLSGDDALTLPILAVGGVGCISVVSNEVPKEFTRLTQFSLAGDFAKAKKIHFALLDLMNINFIETNPQPVKTALAMMGKIQEVFRLPLVSMEPDKKAALRVVLQNIALL